MEKKYKILTHFIKDMSVETNSIQAYLFVKDIISRYHLTIAINSKAIKNKMIEIDTNLKLEDKDGNEYRSNFDIVLLDSVTQALNSDIFSSLRLTSTIAINMVLILVNQIISFLRFSMVYYSLDEVTNIDRH